MLISGAAWLVIGATQAGQGGADAGRGLEGDR